MENSKKITSDFINSLYSYLPSEASSDIDNQLSMILEDILELLNAYMIDDSLLNIDSNEFSSRVQSYNIAQILEFSQFGSKLSFINEINKLFELEILFWEKKYIDNDSVLEKIKEFKDSNDYLEILNIFKVYSSRCEDLAILTNKMLNLLQYDKNQEVLKLKTKNPSLESFFKSLDNSPKLLNEFKLYIPHLKNSKIELLNDMIS